MRKVQRVALAADTRAYLGKRQADVLARVRAKTLQAEIHWKSSRQSLAMDKVLGSLQRMAGSRQRCMYCVDSHGCDIEHFRPKATFPEWMYRWNNLLLCCTECGRLKGAQFPMAGGKPLLLNPAVDEPWQHLDFDPATGNFSPRFDVTKNTFCQMGEATVQVLQLDQREALAAGYQKTYRRLSRRITLFLEAPTAAPELIADLIEQDDHGLLGWFFRGTGQNEPELRQLRQQHRQVWQACIKALTPRQMGGQSHKTPFHPG